MEYIWYIIAALGAGIGTGLAGLSAATVMVPILIVLCPSFASEAGAYQATAIALASDILGSAVTTYVYWKHGNIDLKRGWIMAVCITTMCIAGSIAAWHAGNIVLGSFSLFLTFCIGIRFLVKPDTSRKETVSKGEKLDVKGILISLFFGLTIGFGTGFVGTGGGMMMLVVFTMFLGMDLKQSVGTSTFIMTFTALIASVSHILIDPEIVTQRLDALVICVVTATIASLVSARFANKVSNRSVGLSAGTLLFFLGAAMIFLFYREFFMNSPLFHQVVSCNKYFLGYVLTFAAVMIVLWFLVRIPDYIFRKLLHMIAFSCLVVMTLHAESWQAAALTSVLFAVIVWPLLTLAEELPVYNRLFVQKKPGEIKKSLLLLFFMYAFLIFVCWGILKKPYIAIASILMWGIGDAMAALVGIPFGRHVIHYAKSDGKKTWEGTAAMCISAFIAGVLGLLASKALPVSRCILYPLISAPFAAYTELVTKNGDDTVTVPVVVMTIITILSFLF